MTRVYFIRHGESQANLEQRFAGSDDAPLTAKGREQARQTAEFLKDVPFTAVYASDLSRAYHTGLATAALHQLPVTPVPALREVHAGEWEGRGYTEIRDLYPEDYHVWITQIGLCTTTGGESIAALQQRVQAAVGEIVRRHPGETICIATHATPIRVMEGIWTRTPLESLHTIPWVSNASVTIVEYDETGEGRLVKRDLHDHLGDLSTFVPPTA
ncbi:MAG: histidine phosphatase family protein [Clostridia bacterium]|nr:histidine phosphatase family protein [Clostridia bacterium]